MTNFLESGFNDYEVRKLQKGETIKSFDCGDEDLNDFIMNRADTCDTRRQKSPSKDVACHVRTASVSKNSISLSSELILPYINMLSSEEIKDLNEGTMMETLGIEYLEVKEGYVLARMFVKKELSQPYGMLHGGASMALAESIGGMGSAYYLGIKDYIIRGMQMSANHVKAAKVGTYVYATATIIHKGRQTHVWNIDIKNEDDELVSSCRLTNFIIKKP